MNETEISGFLENLKIRDYEISRGTDNGIPYLYVEISEGRKATIKKLLDYGFKFRIRITDGDNQVTKEYSIKISE